MCTQQHAWTDIDANQDSIPALLDNITRWLCAIELTLVVVGLLLVLGLLVG